MLHLGHVPGPGLPLLLDVLERRDLLDQGGDLLAGEGPVPAGVLQDDRPVEGLGQPPEEIPGLGRGHAFRGHAHDGIGSGLLGGPGIEHRLRHGLAPAPENHRSPAGDRLQNRVQVADPLDLAQQVVLAGHNRPDDPVLTVPAGKVRLGAQIPGVDFQILGVGRRQNPDHAFQ